MKWLQEMPYSLLNVLVDSVNLQRNICDYGFSHSAENIGKCRTPLENMLDPPQSRI